MKKNNKVIQLALLGLANGLLLNAPGLLTAKEAIDTVSSKENYFAMASCKGPKGCGGAVASSCKGPKGCGGAVASSCKGPKGCGGAVASSCKGPKGCGGAVADRDAPTSTTKLQDPAKGIKNPSNKAALDEANDENLGYHLMTEDELMLELNNDGIKQYKSLSPEGKQLARELASQRCGRTNKCAGLNACETESNSCAGKGKCAGQGKCAFSDKNVAVRVVAEKMAEKRANSLNGR